MYLVGHTAIGMSAVALTGVTNPAAAFAVGWASHYLADFLPHGDEEAGDWTKKGNEVKRLAAIVAVDGALLLALFGVFTAHRGFSLPMAMGALGSTVPDVLWGLEKLFKRKLFGFHEKYHYANHNFFDVRMPLWLGVLLQAIMTASLWAWLTLR
jgi:hypothetical protein